jgi:hypothetical protein
VRQEFCSPFSNRVCIQKQLEVTCGICGLRGRAMNHVHTQQTCAAYAWLALCGCCVCIRLLLSFVLATAWSHCSVSTHLEILRRGERQLLTCLFGLRWFTLFHILDGSVRFGWFNASQQLYWSICAPCYIACRLCVGVRQV